jgi:hypothetical protein
MKRQAARLEFKLRRQGRGSNPGGSSGEDDGDEFAAIYGVLATGCGYRYRDIDEMTLLDFEESCSYWQKQPPVHLMVAAYLGIGKTEAGAPRPAGYPTGPQRPAQPPAKPSSPDEAMAIFTGLGHAGSGMIGADIHEGFAVREMPMSFDDLKRLNGL